jgi:peptide/nickel transport system permease protein
MVRRVLIMIPTIILVSFFVFLLMSLAPGNEASILAGPSQNAARIAQLTKQLHLNEPLIVQYYHWLTGAVHGNFGIDLETGHPVATEIWRYFAVTAELAIGAAFVGILLGLPLGIFAGSRPGGIVDHGSRVFSTLCSAIPTFWLAPLLLIGFSLEFHIFPVSGLPPITQPIESIYHLVLPALTLGLLVSAAVLRQLRNSMVEVMESNYIRTLWAKGAGRSVVLRHATRNAVLPAVTVFGLYLGILLGGAVITEQVFSISGMGTYMLTAVTSRDIPVVLASCVLFSMMMLLMSLLVDVAYYLLNPRVRIS